MKFAYIFYFFAGFISVAFSQNYSNREFKFSISLKIQNDWSEPQIFNTTNGNVYDPFSFILISTNEKSGNRITISTIKASDDLPMTDAHQSETFKKGLLESVGEKVQVISENNITFAGVPSYEIVLLSIDDNLQVKTKFITFIANGYQYTINTFSKNVTSFPDPDLDEVVASFRFTEPPVFPKINEQQSGNSRLIGELFAYISVAVIIGFVIGKLRKRQNQVGV